MATRMQQRRGTAAQWVESNSGAGPILNAGEIGWESDTNKFKIGDGTNHWSSLSYFLDIQDLGGDLDDYVPLTQKGAASGVASLDVNQNVLTKTGVEFEGTTADAYETTLTVVDPTADRTITLPDDSGTVQLRVTNVTDTEIGYLDGVTSAIQTQMDTKAPLASPALTGTATAVNLTISGNLTVDGTTTNLNSTNLVVEDKNIILGDTATPTDTTADGGGITLKGTTDKTFNWVDATDAWTSSEHVNLASGKALYLNGTLLKDATETLTNKTLTSPTFTDPSLGTSVTTSTYVAVSYGSTRAASSTDGITWTTRTLPSGVDWESVTFGNSTFVTVSSHYNSTRAATSTDGITWTARTLPASAMWYAVTYGNSTFVAVAEGSTKAATSTDGITWTLRTLPTSGNWRAVTLGNNIFVTVAYNSTSAATSTDGITWTARTLPADSSWYGLTYGNSTFVATSGATSTTAATSTDGITWTLRTLPTTSNWRAVTFGNNTFVAVAWNSTTAASSTDGITWTERTLPANVRWTSVTYAGSKFVAVAYNTSSAASSTDGITWTLRTMSENSIWKAATSTSSTVNNPGTLLVAGSAGTNGQYLQSTGTAVQWATPAAGGTDEQLIVMQAL